MAATNKKNTEETVNKEKEAESVHYIHELREHCRDLFGVKPEVLDGALFNVKKVQITKTEAKKKIDTFLKKEVKV